MIIMYSTKRDIQNCTCILHMYLQQKGKIHFDYNSHEMRDTVDGTNDCILVGVYRFGKRLSSYFLNTSGL